MQLRSLALVAAPVVIGAPALVEKVGPGAQAPAFEGKTWFNQIGRTPTLESLRGRAILIEFWATW